MADVKSQTNHNVSNLTRGLDIMELLLQHSVGLGISDISSALDIPINAVFRIASTLVDRGYLLRDDESKLFTLSPRLAGMGYRAGDRGGLVETAMPLMRELRDEIRETVFLCVMAGTQVMALDGVPGLQLFRFTVDPGTPAPLHASAPGKALVAFLPEAEAHAVISSIDLPRYNKRTITDREALLKEFAELETKKLSSKIKNILKGDAGKAAG